MNLKNIKIVSRVSQKLVTVLISFMFVAFMFISNVNALGVDAKNNAKISISKVASIDGKTVPLSGAKLQLLKPSVVCLPNVEIIKPVMPVDPPSLEDPSISIKDYDDKTGFDDPTNEGDGNNPEDGVDLPDGESEDTAKRRWLESPW